ncbi:hypothetical protein SCA6_011514 [Theobroma cacao]
MLVSPILGVWRGGSLLASSPEYESMCVTKAEYEELGSARFTFTKNAIDFTLLKAVMNNRNLPFICQGIAIAPNTSY